MRPGRILMLITVFIMLAAVAVMKQETALAQGITKDGVQKELKTIEDFRNSLADSMKEAAKRSKVVLHTDEIAISVRGDYVVANSLIAPPKGVPIEEADQMFFVFLSFPANHPFAKKIPTGFYTIERIPKQTIPRAKVINLEGKTVMEVPLNIRKIEMSPPKYATPPKEKVTAAQATIEQSAATLYQDIVIHAHGTICYPRDGVWYWIWIVIVVT
jgi:hypothetical protein